MASHDVFRQKTDDNFLVIVITPTLSAFQVIVSPVPFVKFSPQKISDFNQGVTPG